jgi:hypothetical protein
MGGGAQCAEGPGAAEEGEEGLRSAARLEALRQVRLSASADPGMERFARLVADTLGVPVALVSLVEADRQVFPGQVGLAEPWASGRQAPLATRYAGAWRPPAARWYWPMCARTSRRAVPRPSVTRR